MQRLLIDNAVKPQELGNFMWGLAELQGQGTPLPDQLPGLLGAAAEWAGSRWALLSALDVTDFCFNLGHRPGSDWIGSATERCGWVGAEHTMHI